MLTSAMRKAHAWLESKYDAAPPPYFSEKNHWTYPTFPDVVKSAESGSTIANEYPIEHRGVAYTYGYIGIKPIARAASS